ncbi:uncharacterized protein LOC128549775 [Mercenaria mercenaria]|uniref:uncharacterized protein LOC128549775 n=1 Tax=Mercenaria mercenaria TaxID=6596 RepID=UPI00234EB538|nr:uncharacterized protein LOC128549775 [Mercenaria mercenaria]
MQLSKSLYICLCFFFIQATVGRSAGAKVKSSDVLHKFIRLLSHKSERRSSNDEQVSSYTNNVQNNILIPKSLEQNSAEGLASKSLEEISLEELAPPKSLEDGSMEGQSISPVARVLLKRMMLGTGKQGMSTNRASYGAKISRDLRADHVIGINSRDNSLPWDKECSGGYDHCGGYFPLCCEGFVCLKPLTPWDKKHGFVRCWPDYFQEFEGSDGNADE